LAFPLQQPQNLANEENVIKLEDEENVIQLEDEEMERGKENE
jgi:hypothetical protein